jgi:hypothetical protein
MDNSTTGYGVDATTSLDSHDTSSDDNVNPFAEFYLPKIAASLSMIGSMIVLGEVLHDIRSQKGSIVSRIMLSMCLGDILFSFGWFLG